jgi:phage tail-like protein
MGSSRFAAGRFALELDGTMCGFLKSVGGGAITADVITEPVGSSSFAPKHIGQPRYEELTLQLDLSLEKAVYQWIADTWAGKSARHDGSIVAVSSQQKTVSERQFFRAFLSEVTVPAMDASAKEPAFLTVKIAPEFHRAKGGSGATMKIPAAKSKAWLPSNFRLEIDGLDCKKVSKIEALAVKQGVVPDPVGELREFAKQATQLEFPNLRITLAEAASQTWTSWFDDFVVKGLNSDADEKSGKLSFLTADRKSVLGEVTFFNLGIFRLEPEQQAVDQDTIARIRADLYCERMELKVF